MYLANDVIQNSKKKSPEYGKEFGKILKKAFLHIGETCSTDNKTIGSLGRILKIWEDRAVYDEKVIQEFRNSVNCKQEAVVAAGEVANATKRKISSDTAVNENGKDAETNKKPKPAPIQKEKERKKPETGDSEGAIETHVILSPKAPAGKIILAILLLLRTMK